MKEEFTKADLKSGMVIENRMEELAFVFDYKLLYNSKSYTWSDDEPNDLREYEDNLLRNTTDDEDDYDIMKVYSVTTEQLIDFSSIFDPENLELIWERKDTVFMTIEEMKEELENLTGKRIEVLKESDKVKTIECYCHKHMACNDCVLYEDNNCLYQDVNNNVVKKCYDKIKAEL